MREGRALLIPDLSPPSHPPTKTCLNCDQDKKVCRARQVPEAEEVWAGAYWREGIDWLEREEALPQTGASISGVPPPQCIDSLCPPAGRKTRGGVWPGPEVREMGQAS